MAQCQPQGGDVVNQLFTTDSEVSLHPRQNGLSRTADDKSRTGRGQRIVLEFNIVNLPGVVGEHRGQTCDDGAAMTLLIDRSRDATE